ncbi:Lrp/AsnC family transcriptional regulator [Aromatoleum petrolei]|uniref:siroheme decarboxylase n=1 Tax=Aromatoleum petrolei TaxID=76116 RepID=A0ABX1MRD3_9RHOO|nr:Lrp/AsnC family transcriptional regulator [Aromatoleum petrolei]NMF90514.1 Lrp/AsnC family transcriptional regulator [Aromatoleum petrolei]QTQ35669.1 Heme d1 biosynthesis protein [Aromatoleum petrolei]
MARTAADELERRIIVATQGGLPLVSDPWGTVARDLGITPEELLAQIRSMLDRGVIRRIGAVPNHYAIGYTANGMSVWDVADGTIDAVGEWLGSLAAVTHCYRRPRSLPDWPYNLFAMLHGRSHDAVRAELEDIAARLEARFPGACRARDVLFSSAILKKTGLRIAASG